MARSAILYGSSALLCAVSGVSLAAGVHGRVLVDDQIPPATPIHVELVCNGQKIADTVAAPNGSFEFTANANAACAITAELSGYTSQSIRVDRLPLDAGIGGLALRREGKWEGFALSATTLATSESALAFFTEGVQTLRGGGQANMAKAERLFARAAEEDPQFAEAFFHLARLRLSREDLPGAREALQSALAADPWFVSPYKPLLMLELADEHWSASRALCDKWLRMAPHSPDARFYRALSALELRDLRAARAELRVIEAGPDASTFAPVSYLRGRVFEYEGHGAEALAEYRIYLAAEPDGPLAADAQARLAKDVKP